MKGDLIMTMYINGKLAGMVDSAKNAEYQAKLDEKVSELFGDKTQISVQDLKKNSIFNKVYKSLNKAGKENFDKVLSLDGDAQNISEKELKTLLTLLDADLYNDNGQEIFLMDNNIGTNKKTGGIYKATDKEIQQVYGNIQTRAEKEAAEIQKQKEMEQKSEQLIGMVKDYDYKNGSDVAKALNIIRENSEIGSSEGLEVHDNAIYEFFKEQVVDVDSYRDGGSRLYYLEDGTKIYHDNSISSMFRGESGAVTITHPDGTEEKYNNKGEKIE
jgi:hypothetical protein